MQGQGIPCPMRTQDKTQLKQSKTTQPSPPPDGAPSAKEKVRVIKADQVRLCGSLCLDLPAAAGHKGPVRPLHHPGAHAPAAHAGTPQQARILESNDEYAIIEVTCSCGAKSHIQCNYASLTKS